MNYNPRKLALAFGAAAALTLGMTACGSQSDAPAIQTPQYERPDCDLDDLEQGDKDCNDPIAYADAVHRYGPRKVAEAKRKYAEKKAKEKARKHINKIVPPTSTRPAAQTTVRPVAPATPLVAAPKTHSTKSTSDGGFFARPKSNFSKPFGSTKRK